MKSVSLLLNRLSNAIWIISYFNFALLLEMLKILFIKPKRSKNFVLKIHYKVIKTNRVYVIIERKRNVIINGLAIKFYE